MARPAAIWQTAEILQQPATRNQQIREVFTRSKPHCAGAAPPRVLARGTTACIGWFSRSTRLVCWY